MMIVQKCRRAGVLATMSLLLLSCEVRQTKTDQDPCAYHCDVVVACGHDTAESCQAACTQRRAAGQAVDPQGCYTNADDCRAIEDCLTCSDYCTPLTACGFEAQPGACDEDCHFRLQQNQRPLAESCVLNEDCDTASVCLLCDQYCERLQSCEVSTDSSCSSSCQTVIQAGADVAPYRCVIDSSCSEVANCGI